MRGLARRSGWSREGTGGNGGAVGGSWVGEVPSLLGEASLLPPKVSPSGAVPISSPAPPAPPPPPLSLSSGSSSRLPGRPVMAPVSPAVPLCAVPLSRQHGPTGPEAASENKGHVAVGHSLGALRPSSSFDYRAGGRGWVSLQAQGSLNAGATSVPSPPQLPGTEGEGPRSAALAPGWRPLWPRP